VCGRDGAERTLAAPTIALNTGTRPSRPPLPGLDTVPALDSTSIMELDEVPEHLIVIGGGYIGLEFGQMFRRFGAAVTIVQRAPALLGREDPDVADAVAEILRDDGLDVLLSTTPVRVGRRDDGRIALVVRDTDGERTLVGSHLLVATGRVPNTEALALDVGGVRTDARGFVVVNDRLETSAPGVFAAGDVNGGPAFTHVSYDDFRILRRNLLGDGGGTRAGRLLPYVMYIDPQLGRVGLSESDAVAAGYDVRVARMPMSYVARALETDEPRGFMKVVVDATTERLLGVAVLGAEGGELASALQIAIMGGLPYTALRDAVFAHPTFAEGFNNLFASLEPSRLTTPARETRAVASV
jgi:pyruvate/2-oxoglutarate dehydrogenase complex dihydrolipoamide dehydrogenase (E3) component